MESLLNIFRQRWSVGADDSGEDESVDLGSRNQSKRQRTDCDSSTLWSSEVTEQYISSLADIPHYVFSVGGPGNLEGLTSPPKAPPKPTTPPDSPIYRAVFKSMAVAQLKMLRRVKARQFNENGKRGPSVEDLRGSCSGSRGAISDSRHI